MGNEKNRKSFYSPCIRNCCLDENDICMGCFRSLTEITQWTLVDIEIRQEFLNNAEKRKIQSKRDDI